MGSHTDFAYRSLGADVRLRRTYNSNSSKTDVRAGGGALNTTLSVSAALCSENKVVADESPAGGNRLFEAAQARPAAAPVVPPVAAAPTFPNPCGMKA